MNLHHLLSRAFALLLLFVCNICNAQSFGINASAVYISNCNQSNFFNTTGTSPNLIGPVANVFNNANLGVYTQNQATLILRGAEIRTFKNIASSNICSATLNYRVYLQSGTPGAFNQMVIPLLEDCDVPTSAFPSGGPCVSGDQKWNRVIPNGTITPYAPVDLTAYAPGNYILELYYEITGSNSSTSLCNETLLDNNGGLNFKAVFSIQSPAIVSTNPTTCNGTNGFITINGLVPGATYIVNYTDDGTAVGPLSLTANSSGQLIISGLNAGIYSNFSLEINGCLTNLFTGVILSNPLSIPTFGSYPPFCSGNTAPVLPPTSLNGITGTWSPSTVSNTTSGTYTFTPNSGQCAIPVSINITIIPRTTPVFSFGTTLTICSGGTVPTLPGTSTNGITGTWSPTTVSNTTSGTYTFTPTAGQCATTTTFTVTVNPNITPIFSFGTTLTICSGGTVPTLPSTSTNGITGTWNPTIVSNTTGGTYTFTPTAGQCATTTTFTVTVNPNITPVFPFGTTLTICSGGTVPTLPNTSTNGITGTWNPSTVSNTTGGTYTFTPTAGQCATTTTFTVTVNPNITPIFSFGTTLTICSGGTVPTLPGTSTNGITGTWNPTTVSNATGGTYTFTPTAGQCATTTTFTVTVNPNITPIFSFGTMLTICSGGTVPTLPNTSTNGITGTWNPTTVSNTTGGTYTFTPTAGQCATTTTFTVTVNPNITPVFSFGTTLTICSGGTVPTLPSTSTNGITGTWNPTIVSNTTGGTYTFTPTAGQCATTTTFTVTVNPNITPVFSFGTTLTICSGGTVPTLPNTSTNGITGTWSPATVSTTVSNNYVFTSNGGTCVSPYSFTVTVNPNITPVFPFGTNQSICIGGAVPALSTTSTNGITGTWSPATVSNTTDGIYTFTPTAGQCATGTTFTLQVNLIPTVSVPGNIIMNDGDRVPASNFLTNPLTGVNINWTNSNTAIGLFASGAENVPSFTATNTGSTDISGTVTVTPRINGCIGSSGSYIITIKPLNKDVFVPNVFSPNGDGKNDILKVYGNYIEKIEMRIFNQWGEQITIINSTGGGWDGTHKGKQQPVGVYVYVLRAELREGKKVELKGSITLVR